MYKIDKGIPVQTGNIHDKYPFAHMQVGDSFFAADGDIRKMRNASTGWGRRHGAKFSLSAVVEDNKKGVRVWRTD